MKIGNVEIKGHAALAPMAGVADRAFRELCMGFGAAYVVSEMVSAKGVSYSNVKSKDMLVMAQSEHPCAVQLFGCEPETVAAAAIPAAESGADIIDINMGCPAPKVTSNGCGSALMKKPRLCGEVGRAVCRATDLPVTVKIRKGWDNDSVNACEVAKICEENGASAITIHGRTREQFYAPSADWDIIREVKKSVSIPVIGNGDIETPEQAAAMLEETGCDMVMIGRGALGNPWIFMAVNAWLDDMRQLPPPGIEEKLTVMVRHIRLMCEYKGENIGMREARKHAAWYLKGFSGAAELRNRAGRLTTLSDLDSLAADAYRMYLKKF